MKTTSEAQAKNNFVRRLLTVYVARFTAVVVAVVWASSFVSTTHTSAQTTYTGQWIIEPARETSQLQLTLTYSSERVGGHRGRGDSITSFGLVPEQLRGLTQAQMMSAGATVQFQIVRDAGTFNCEGWFKGGKGSGHFVFAGNPSFVAELRSRTYDTPTEAQLFSLAMNDVSIAFIDELKAQGYERPSLDQLVRMGDHGVTLAYVRELKAQGYSLQTTEMLTRMVDHGVSISFIKEMDALGYKQLPAETLVRTVDHELYQGAGDARPQQSGARTTGAARRSWGHDALHQRNRSRRLWPPGARKTGADAGSRRHPAVHSKDEIARLQ